MLYSVKEKTGAAYVQANFAGDALERQRRPALRAHRTAHISNTTVSRRPTPISRTAPSMVRQFGPICDRAATSTYNDLLPSANFKYELTDDWCCASPRRKTLTRPDYSALAGSVSLSDLTHTGSGGNPDLEPLISTNFDAALEWYFAAARAAVGQRVLDEHQGLRGASAPIVRPYLDQTASAAAGQDVFVDYGVHPGQRRRQGKGFELVIRTADRRELRRGRQLHLRRRQLDGGTSRCSAPRSDTYNVSGYFENDKFNFRLSYTYRSDYYAGVSRTDDFYQDEHRQSVGIGSATRSTTGCRSAWMR